MEKEGPVEFEVSAEEFKASGWHIPRAQLIKKNSIGKGEYGGTYIHTYIYGFSQGAIEGWGGSMTTCHTFTSKRLYYTHICRKYIYIYIYTLL